MFKSSKQIVSIVIVIGFIATGLAFAWAPSNSSAPTGHASLTPASYIGVTDVFIENNLSVPTPAYFDERLVVDSALYSVYENSNLSNIFFTTFNGTVVPSWLEYGNNNIYNNTTYWLKIAQPIPAHSLLVIYMDAAYPFSSSVLNNYSIGEAPQLSAVYGQYDDGSHVFGLYDNFSGTKLKTSLWLESNPAVTVINNGITFNDSAYITSRQQFSSPSYVESYGVMNNPLTSGSTTYDLGGVGFGNDGINNTAPVMTSGWAENNTNAIGLTVYNGTGGPYQFNVSSSINPLDKHVFGTGFINTSLVSTSIDNVIENYSTIPLEIPPAQGLNVTLGFQTNNFPTTNNFSWIFERNSTSNGLNPYSTLQGYSVNMVESGLPSGDLWGLTINNVEGIANGGYVNGNASYNFPNGTYNYSITSTDNSYMPVNATSSFTVTGSAIAVNITFEAVTYNTTFIENGLPAGTTWSVSIDNGLYSSNSPLDNVPLINGSYTVNISPVDGYQAYPNMATFVINGLSNSYGVSFESPANASYIRGSSTIYPDVQQTYSGYNLLQFPYSFGVTSIALDQKDNLLFTTYFVTGNVSVQNLTTGSYIGNVSLSGNPVTSYYDPNSGYLYVGDPGNGTVDIVDPLTMSVVNVIPVPDLIYTFFTIVPGTQPNLLYAFGYNGTNNSNATIYTFNLSGSVLDEVNFSNMHPPGYYWSYFVPTAIANAPPIYDNTLLVGNLTGIVAVNVSTGSEAYAEAPIGYAPGEIVPFGAAGNYIVGNLNGDSNYTFNISSMTYASGPDISGTVTSGVLDNLNGIEYLSTFSSNTGNVTAVSPKNNTVLASAPSLIPSLNMVFDSRNQNLYSLDLVFTSDAIHVYSLMKAYSITFSETGISQGSWYVNITGQASSGPIDAGSTYTVALVNSTYSYTISTSNKLYSANGGTVDVNGPATVSIRFNPVEFEVTFRETGLPANANWTVTINGLPHTGNSTEIIISLQNNTYSYTISSVSGYSITNQTGNVTVNGSAVTESIEFSANPPASNTSITLYVIIGGAVGVVAVGSGLLYLRRMHKYGGPPKQ